MQNAGRAVAPAAQAALATISHTLLPAGYYDVHVKASVSGAAAAENGNIGLYTQVGVAALVAVAAPTPSGISGAWSEETYSGMLLDGTQDLVVAAIGAGTASIVYSADVEARRES